jgi:DUF1365 family protein
VKLRESGVQVPKEHYVSPFNPVDIDFHFRLHLPDENLRVFIDDYDAEGKVLVSIKRVSFYWKETRVKDQRGVFGLHKSLKRPTP